MRALPPRTRGSTRWSSAYGQGDLEATAATGARLIPHVTAMIAGDLADQREPEAMEFLRAVPSVWDETHVIDARIGDYVITARRTGREWFIGAITDWNAREFDVDLSFLPAGQYQLTEWRDGVNADRNAEDFRQASQLVNNTMKFHIRLAEGGGWAAKITAK